MMRAEEIADAARSLRDFVRIGIKMDDACRYLADLQPKHADIWLAIAQRTGLGGRLGEQLRAHKLWPESSIAAVDAGEISNSLDQTLDAVADFQSRMKEVNKTVSSKLIAPIGYVGAGVLIFIVYMLFVFPSVTKSIKGEDRTGFIAVSDLMVQLKAENGVEVLVGVIVFVAGLIFTFRQPAVKATCFNLIDMLPGIGQGLRSIYYGLWSQYMVILDRAGDIEYADMVDISSSVLPSAYQPSMKLLVRESAGGKGLITATDSKKWSSSDPRRRWPLKFTVGLKTSAIAGDTAGPLSQISAPLIQDGLDKLQKSLAVVNLIAMAIAALCIISPMAAMMLAQFDAVNNLR